MEKHYRGKGVRRRATLPVTVPGHCEVQATDNHVARKMHEIACRYQLQDSRFNALHGVLSKYHWESGSKKQADPHAREEACIASTLTADGTQQCVPSVAQHAVAALGKKRTAGASGVM